jgi:hypothetical protein
VPLSHRNVTCSYILYTWHSTTDLYFKTWSYVPSLATKCSKMKQLTTSSMASMFLARYGTPMMYNKALWKHTLSLCLSTKPRMQTGYSYVKHYVFQFSALSGGHSSAWETVHGTQWTGDRVGLKASLDLFARRLLVPGEQRTVRNKFVSNHFSELHRFFFFSWLGKIKRHIYLCLIN